MGKRVMWTDDLDGSDIGEDASPITFSVGTSAYKIYLSDKNHEKFLNVLKPYMDAGEKVSRTAAAPAGSRRSGGASNTDKERNKAVRAWAQSTGFKYAGADGEERTLGDRGQIPPVVYEAYDVANG